MFFNPRLEKYDSLIIPGSYILNLKAHQDVGVVHSGWL